jgi:multiple sugar transport system permease protein
VKKRVLGWLADAALVLYFVFALFPIAWMVILSLKPADQLFSTYFSFSPTLDGYRTVLGDSEGIPFVRFFVNSLVVSVGAVVLSLVVGLPAAYASARWRFKGSENLMFTLLSFRFAPELTVIIPLFVLYQKLGLFDTYVGMVWVLQLVTLPLIVWIMRSYFADLTPELEQAALLDGYTRKRAFVMVALPLVRPGIAAAALLAFIFAWNNYVFPLILTDSRATPVTVAVTKFLGGGGQAYYNLTAAAALIGALPPLILALTIQRYLVRGLSFGAVKA